MTKSVSNVLTMWKLNALTDGGVDVSFMLNKCNISDYELNKANGRISQTQHYDLILETSKYNDVILNKQSSMEFFYQLFPDLFGLCMNEFSACKSMESFIRYRAIMGDCDICEIKNNSDSFLIEYKNEGPRQLANGSAVGNFLLFFDILKKYLPTMSLQIGFAGHAITSEKIINEQFQSKCLFNQGVNSLLVRGKGLNERSDFFNEKLNQLQKAKAEKICFELQKSKLFSQTVAEIIEGIINSHAVEGGDTVFDGVCSMLKQSRWTINKRLQAENTNFTEILKNVRFNMACKLLVESNKTIQEISELIFFSSQAIFSRFFSSHANISPVKYRNKNRVS